MSEPDTNPDYPYDPGKVWPHNKEWWFPDLVVDYTEPQTIGFILGPNGEVLKEIKDKEFRGYRL